MMLLLAVTTCATARAENTSTLRCGIEYFTGGIGCIYLTGWVYDSDPTTKWWQAGEQIEVSAIATTKRFEYEQGYERIREHRVEYFVRNDINEAYGLPSNSIHGFRIAIDVDAYSYLFQDDEGNMIDRDLWVNVYATVNNGNGDEEILLSGPIEVPYVKSPFWEFKSSVTQVEFNELDDTYLFTGFHVDNMNVTDDMAKMTDGNLNTRTRDNNQLLRIDEFWSDEIIIPVGIRFSTVPGSIPGSWTLSGKLNKNDKWTTLRSGEWPNNLPIYSLSEVYFKINNEDLRGYRYFLFEARPRSGNMVSLREIHIQCYRFMHLLPRLATCSQVGLIRECYQNSKTGKYYADDAATTEYDASYVEIPKTSHDCIACGNNVWQCWMCRNYFSDEACTTSQPTWSVTLPEHTEIVDATPEKDGSGKFLPGTVITFKAEDRYAPYISNVKIGETELTPDQDGNYTLTVGNANVVVTAKIALLELADYADNAAALCALSGQQVVATLKGRTLYKDGLWNTLCLPFNMTAQQVSDQLAPTRLMTLGSESLQNEILTLNFADATEIQAGKPYLIRWAKTNGYVDDNEHNLYEPTFYDVTIPDTYTSADDIAVALLNASCRNDYIDFIGTFAPLTFKSEDRSILFLRVMANANILSYPAGNVKIGSQRAYFQQRGLQFNSNSSPLPIKEFALNFGEDDATSIDPLTIDHYDKDSWFDLNGRKLAGEPTQKGVYIVNGKKILK